MAIINELEEYFNVASNITIGNDGFQMQLFVIFPYGTENHAFGDGYNTMKEYFNNEEITVTIMGKEINKEDAFYRTSFVNKNTGDAINLNNAFWGQEDLNAFRESFDENSQIPFRIGVLNADGSGFTRHDDEPIMLDGHVFKEYAEEGKEEEKE